MYDDAAVGEAGGLQCEHGVIGAAGQSARGGGDGGAGAGAGAATRVSAASAGVGICDKSTAKANAADAGGADKICARA